MQINRSRQLQAEMAAMAIRNAIKDGSNEYPLGIILGTGWQESLMLEDPREVDFRAIGQFKGLGNLEGHARTVVCGRLEGINTVALRGRVHMNEAPCDPNVPKMVRLQTEMLFCLGVKNLIITSAVGSLKDAIKVGDVVFPNGLVTLFAPEMPLWAGEFCSPEDALDMSRVHELFSGLSRDRDSGLGLGLGLSFHVGGHVMLRGPYFEGRRYDKRILKEWENRGPVVVGMSLLPEACVTALYGKKFVGVCFVTNTDSEEHSHEENMRRAKEKSESLARLLKLVAKTYQ